MGICVNWNGLSSLVEGILRAGRVPGAAVAVVSGGSVVFAQGFGHCQLGGRLPVTPQTIYPIASTTKSINATLLGTLVDEGLLAWDARVRDYLPRFRMHDERATDQVTLRDLLIMRTGLPRHDWVWVENAISRNELVECLRYLPASAGFRERFQYNNITVAVAGHVAEVVTGQSWQSLVQRRVLAPLSMDRTLFQRPSSGEVTEGYHENSRRELITSRSSHFEVTAPAGSVMHSTIADMARWVQFNLNGGWAGAARLIRTETLAELHAPQAVVGADPSAPSPHAAYGIGWFVDSYNGRACILHGGYVNDVNSDIMLFPDDNLGIVSFVNFGPPTLARLVNQHCFDFITARTPLESLEDKLAIYEQKIRDSARRVSATTRVASTSPSHPLTDYAGRYTHPAYGSIEISCSDRELKLRRGELVLALEHWHYDAWVASDDDRFLIHVPHTFDRAGRLLFETNGDGRIAALTIGLEPALRPVCFTKGGL
jgi:CubicO group peptidase (beta-lactamase class C family)